MGLIIGLSRHQGTIVYSLLGLDWLFLFAQFGGYAVTELQVHALFLSLAALVLALNRQALKLPKLGWALVGIPLLVFGLLLIPASPSAMAWLNPVKADLAQQTASLFPALKASPQLAITPPLHLFKGLRWITDIALCLILINCPRPQFGLFRAIIRLVAAFVFILANMQANGLLAGKGWIHRYADTMGGIVNPNHFATAVILILFLLLSINLREIQKLRKRRLSGAMSQDRLLRKMAFIALDWFLILLGLLAWRESHSRAGMILMVVGMAFFICMLLWPIMGKNRWLILPGGITVATLLLLFVPFGTLITKWEREGTSLGSRTEALQVGFDYLKQRPWLGTGLQSSYTLLQNRMPISEVNLTIWHDFHNEYLQVVLEWGVPGLIWLILCGVGYLALLRKSAAKTERPFAYAAACAMVLVVALHGLGEFPLRNPAIKMTFLMGLCTVLHRWDKKDWIPLPWGGVVLTLASLSVFIAAQSLKNPAEVSLSTPHSAISIRYGRGFESHLFSATQQFQNLMQGKSEQPSPELALSEIRRELIAYHRNDPANLRCFNLWFATEVIEARLNGRPTFSELEAKAYKIRALGAGELDANADVATFFLLEVYASDLDESHLTELKKFKKRYREVQPK